MGAILIKADSENYKPLIDLAKTLGAEVLPVKEEDPFEAIAFVTLLEKIKKHECVSIDEIVTLLQNP